jgi:RNA polymerase sigma-70 factor, ECF subfamily
LWRHSHEEPLRLASDNSSVFSSVADLAMLGKLFDEHRGRLMAMIERRLSPALAARVDPEDVLSQVFIDAQRKWAAFKERTSLGATNAAADISPYAWLYGIARDRICDTWEFETRGLRNVQLEARWPERSSMQLVMGLVASETSPSGRLAGEELRQQMLQILAMLKEKDREILWMRHHDDLSFLDIAAVLSITDNAARVRYVRALDRLRTLWQGPTHE